jgi:cytochrome P450
MWLTILVGVAASILAVALYQVILHPLSHVPGPFPAKISSIFLHLICYLGIEGRVVRYYHEKYKTKVLRLTPNSVSISDPEAIATIYVKGGGFPKDDRYQNFNLGPIVSIFSAIDKDYRDVRAKAVAPLFSPAQIRLESAPEGVIGSCISEFVTQLQENKASHIRTDIMDLCARLSIDIVTVYLLGERYGGLHENSHLPLHERQSHKLSANHFIFSIVAFARFSLLPNRIFRLLYSLSQRMSKNEQVVQSFATLDRYVRDVMARTSVSAGSAPTEKRQNGLYHERLMSQAGASPAEASAQAKAVVFAGADSTAVMLATVLFHLVRNPAACSRLLCEIRSPESQDLRFLRAVVKEGLRLGMANPTRLTRIVPHASPGLRVGNVLLPPGTIVGCAAYNLHHDADIFPHPFSFRPERWLDDETDSGLRRPGMDKAMIPFGAGTRACIGKNLAQQQLHDTVMAVIDSEVLDGARTCEDRIEMIEWFNGDIKGHEINIMFD